MPVVTALLAVNLSVAWLGESRVFPLSTRHLPAKVDAVGLYLRHRSGCLLRGHGDLRPVIEEVAGRHGLDPLLLRALVEVESGSRPHRISPAGAMGPAQLIGSTAAHLKVADPFDPHQGIDGGARYLKAQLRRFKGDTRLALAAYNAGPGSVRGGRVPRNGETEFYVPRVLHRWEALKREAPAEVARP